MRLTLRTLLAYLDHTLAPHDEEVLRQKLADSGQATNLVRQIRAAIGEPRVGAPDPRAAGPVEDPNVMSEYLDSTLSDEQVVELERRCLSDSAFLAEAAACHQILTMVLGRPAGVSDDLRTRILGLGSIPGATEAAGNFSSIEVPAEAGEEATTLVAGGAPGEVSQTPGASAANGPAGSAAMVDPVGRDDSGVTRVRPFAADRAAEVTAPRRLETESSFRPTRITPYLVAAAVLALLLFSLSKIFRPAIRDVADNGGVADVAPVPDEGYAVTDDADIETLPAPRPSAAVAPIAASLESDREAGGDIEPRGDIERTADVERAANVEPAAEIEPEDAYESVAPPPPGGAAPVARPNIAPESGGDRPALSASESAEDGADVVEMAPPPPPGVPVDSDGANAGSDPAVSPDPEPSVDVADEPAPEPPPEPVSVGNLGPGVTLALVRSEDDPQPRRVTAGENLRTGQTLRVAPTFTATFGATDGPAYTLLGPGTVRFERRGDAGVPVLLGGRLIVATDDPTEVRLEAGGRSMTFQAETDTRLGIAVRVRREPGADVDDPTNRVTETTVILTNAAVTWAIDDEAGTLMAPAGLRMIDAGTPTTIAVDDSASWVRDGVAGDQLSDLARDGLLRAISDERPLALQLREAVAAPRPETAALASRTLLMIGDAEAYFGRQGVLENPRQRIHWPDHFEALRRSIDSSPDAAAAVFESARQMDSGHADEIQALLRGYTEEEFRREAAERLVEQLDSPSMTIRVLSVANLRERSGLNFSYRPDYETEARREPGIRRWQTALRRGTLGGE